MPYKVQWCHGAPGFIPEFATASKVFANDEYLHRAQMAADFTIEQGILKKGLQLGHGTYGNFYLILTLYQQTCDPKYLYYFYELHKIALDTPTLSDVDQMMAYDCVDYSIFLSSVGSAISAYGDFLANFKKDRGMMNLRMAGWEAPVFETEISTE
mmetsp:Transcript_18395/g.17504  ORF Transcript_18395/g.17504 Transcript_18395/m.17504 type:complete len:155 (-) Transcript_18395:51-515(-)|eukprot:CAMPEP_0170553906 /NCGR_PEP_ID=MMETSP0211-20121228/11741_1 /TAXON_ID=311385 /ORGANISM="Pseudokeronopsis sp., Strain OXSARD2" /LENGTH=154 /DNA_ID=CAMNT_0010862559 /DNA_START=893 /DNA_END=1357 /DNA_ORIENTATION=-